MAVTTEELKTIAATSAIAAAGGALATALVTYALDRWIFSQDEEPMFVVVPVVEREVPALPTPEPPPEPETPPLIAGYGGHFGALSERQRREIERLKPWRYWEEFYQCYEQENPAYMTPRCKRLNAMYDSMSEENQEQLNEIVTVPHVGKNESILYLVLAGGVGMAAGILIGASIS